MLCTPLREKGYRRTQCHFMRNIWLLNSVYGICGGLGWFGAYGFIVLLTRIMLCWMPCEHEALAISTSTTHFGPFITESIHPTKIWTDSKPCKEAHDRLRNVYFSTSARISTFLSTLSTYNVTMEHLKGTCNKSSDYSSRNPQECLDKECQIYKFVYEQTTATCQIHSVWHIVRCLENAIYQSSGMEICSTRMQNPVPCICPLDTRNKTCQKGMQSERPSKISSNCHSWGLLIVKVC